MNEYADLSFGSYDRFIPSQDNLPSDNGLGNLIALPLQGSAGKRGYSLFIDEDFKHYPDQWEYLSTIKRIHPLEVDQVISNLSQSDNLGELIPNTEEDEIDGNSEKEQPWEKKKSDVNLTAEDFNGEIEIISANVIYIEKSKLSVRAINKLVRLGAYKNPEFYKAQARRKRTDDKPRIVSTVDEDSGYICIPRGALNDIKNLLENAGTQYYVTDKTTEGRALDVSFIGELKEDQIPAVDALLSHEIGVFSAAGGFGKTVIGTYLIAKRAVNTLVLVHSDEVYEQWKGALQKHLEINDSPAVRVTPKGRERVIGVIGEYSGKKKHLSGLVDVAMTQSLSRDVDEKLFIKDYGMVIIDECHRIPAVTFEAVLKQVNAKYVYGLTATPYRDDGHHAILFLRCGPIRYKVDDREQAKKRPFNHYVIPRFTELLPTSVHDTDNTQQLITEVGADPKRNELIINDIMTSIKAGRNPIVLSERVEHVKTLAGLLSKKCANVIVLTGSMKTEEKRIADRILSEVKDGDEYVIVATGKYAGEGFDFPRLDTLFLVLPISFKGKINQYTGRLHRLYEGKKDVIVYDYVDINIPMLERMYYKRVSGYKSVGYKTLGAPVLTSKIGDVTNIIFAYNDYLETFCNDVVSATGEIVLSCPYLTSSGVASLIKTLSVKIIENIIVTIITRPTDEHVEDKQLSVKNCVQRLVDAGVKVVECSGLHQRFAVIDQNITWYGSVNFLGFSRNYDNVMRLVDTDIATKILKQHHGHKTVSRSDEQISLFALD
jgi:superfamily II DNA or RNA helicase